MEKKKRVMKNSMCQVCKIKALKVDMEFEMVGTKTPVAKYYHKGICWETYLKEKAFKDNERVEMDALVEIIKEIYGVKAIPNSCFVYINELRNGTTFFGKNDYKYKEGYSYELMTETFSYVSESIEYANRTKTFKGFNNAFRYGLAIVCDKLSVVENRRKLRQKQNAQINKHLEKVENEEAFVDTYKKKEKSKTDITDFLDE